MKEGLTVNKKRFSAHRIVGALMKGFFWGWVLSFCLSVFYWNVNGFDQANGRLINMMHTEWQIDKTYSDTKAFSFLMSMSDLVSRAVKEATHSNAANMADHQIKDAIGDQEQGYLSPAEHKASQFWHIIKQAVKKTGMIAKNNSLMVLGKFLLFVLALPLLGLSWLFGVVDGLALREIRTAEFGRESSFIFHRFLGFIPGVLCLLITLYLLVPLWINPVVFFLVVSLMTFLLASRTVSKFKKYV
jgi:integrating conjugative element membrane protein (TIGR03747 family)